MPTSLSKSAGSSPSAPLSKFNSYYWEQVLDETDGIQDTLYPLISRNIVFSSITKNPSGLHSVSVIILFLVLNLLRCFKQVENGVSICSKLLVWSGKGLPSYILAVVRDSCLSCTLLILTSYSLIFTCAVSAFFRLY